MVTKCPNCGSEKVVFIVFGLPKGEMVDSAQRGEIALGRGLRKGDDIPDLHCKECGCDFYSK